MDSLKLPQEDCLTDTETENVATQETYSLTDIEAETYNPRDT